MRGRFDGERVSIEEIHRFPNEPVQLPDGLHWDILRLYHEVLTGIGLAARDGNPVASVSIDTWGTDYGLIDDAGRLIGNPYHYRDPRTEGMPDRVFAHLPAAEVYAATGSQTIRFNTLFQLLVDAGQGSLRQAASMLMTPDLLAFWLTGEQGSEATIASTSQLFDPHERDWSWDLIDRLGLPPQLFRPVSEPGAIRGRIREPVRHTLGLHHAPPVVAGGSHDTASAFAAAQASPGTLVISSGTWSLIGIETGRPIISEAARTANFTNEAGVAGTNRFLRNASGMWLLQECRRTWNREGATFSYADLTALASRSAPFAALIDPDDPMFLAPGDMPARIVEYCRRAGQPAPTGKGAIIRCVLESLALNERSMLEEVERVSGRHIDQIQIVGGGSLNALRCQLTADATGRPVLAGPSEATALGNIMVQAMALNEVASLDEIREVIQRSTAPLRYEPSADRAVWDEAFARITRIRSRP